MLKTINWLLAASLILILGSCLSLGESRKNEVLMTDKDFVEFTRIYSPDGKRMLLNYGLDLGATGYGKCGTAILNLTDSTKNLRLLTLSNSYVNVKWLSNQKISAQREVIPFLRSGEKVDLSPQKINGIDIDISAYDFIEPNYHMEIEHQETSPDGQHELVAYRYFKNLDNLNFIHVSIIAKGSPIPKYGNFLIGEPHSDYVFWGKWSINNELIFYTNDICKDMVQYCLVKNRPKIPYALVTNDTNYQNQYRWREKK
jgi:hypothetical protein